jgi:hypothetical protein
MFLIKHIKYLWNGGLNPANGNPVSLRERRTLSTTIFIAIPVAALLFVSNYYTDGERDNVYIAIAIGVLFLSLCIQAYLNQQLLASQLPIFTFWVVMCIAMLSVGL